MGTDIHGIIAEEVPNPNMNPFITEMTERSRNYRAFAALADVRNGSGFAGVPTHRPINPLDEPRGIPDDIKAKMIIDDEGIEVVKTVFSFEDNVDLGDHSFTWFTLREVLDYDWDQTIDECGIVDRAFFEAWDGESCPPGWSGGIGGPDIIVADHSTGDMPEGWTHIRINWARKLRDAAAPYPAYFEYLATKYDPDTTRIVVGFDS